MTRSILLGLDGSEYCDALIGLGIRMAKRTGAFLVGMGIIDEPSIREAELSPIGGNYYKEERDEALIADARRKVEGFLEYFTLCCTRQGVPSKLHEETGSPYERLIYQAQRYDLLMLGQQTYFHFETQDGPDETLQHILRDSPRPVLTSPKQWREGSSVVIAYDGSLQASRTLANFVHSGLNKGLACHVITLHKDLHEATRIAGLATDFLGFHDIAAVAYPVAGESSVAKFILAKAEELKADLLVMGAYGHSSLREFLFGSVTKTVLREAEVPLFLYH